MSDRIDHAARSRRRIESVLSSYSTGEDAGAVVVALAALNDATLALVEQQRIANLIALANASAMSEGYDDTEEARRQAAYALIEYRLVDPDTEYPVIRPEIAAALGIEAGEAR